MGPRHLKPGHGVEVTAQIKRSLKWVAVAGVGLGSAEHVEQRGETGLGGGEEGVGGEGGGVEGEADWVMGDEGLGLQHGLEAGEWKRVVHFLLVEASLGP